MQNVNVKSENDENKTLSLSSVASITETVIKPQDDGQSKTVSAACQNVSTIERPYGSMPNISAFITTDGDTTAIQEPTAVAVQQVSTEPLENCPKPIKLANYAGPQMWYYIELVNAAVMVPPAAAGEAESRSQSVTSDRKVSAAEPKHGGSGEWDAKMSRGSACLPPRRLWSSMPNIAIHYTDKVFYETAESECIAPIPVSDDSLTGSSTTVTEPAEVSPVKIKRCSLWKRTKKFARRVFCCGAA